MGSVRIEPFLISQLKDDPAYKNWDVKASFLKREEEMLNKDGYVVHQGVWAAQGRTISPNAYIPPFVSATFAIGDGSNHSGGFTYYELRVHQGLIRSSGELFQTDCSSKEWSSCTEKKLENAVQMGPVYHDWGKFGEHGVLSGTVVTAYMVIPSP